MRHNPDIPERLLSQRDEDGFCLVCGDGKWESHFPECTLNIAADEIEQLRSFIIAWADADEAARRAGRYSNDAVIYEMKRDALRKAVGR